MSDQQVTDCEQHQLGMLLWQADIHERNARKQEAFEIRAWVADFLSPQSEEEQAFAKVPTLITPVRRVQARQQGAMTFQPNESG